MASPHERLANSLSKLQRLQNAGKTVIRSSDLTRTHLERLIDAGYLRRIAARWYMPSRPDDQMGDSTSWYASMREFIHGYCNERFGDNWYVNPGLSLELQTGSTVLPKQVIVLALKGGNHVLQLPFSTSLFDLKTRVLAPTEDQMFVQGLRALRIESAIVLSPPKLWETEQRTMRLALEQVQDTSVLNYILLRGGHSAVAGRIAGAFRAVGRDQLANEITGSMRSAGYPIIESNPFSVEIKPVIYRNESPYCSRVRTMWSEMRSDVLSVWTTPKLPLKPIDQYLAQAEGQYVSDAYHSLSIEGYKVTALLIERIRKNEWSPENNPYDKNDRDTLAAKGYFNAHVEVRKSITTVFAGSSAGAVLSKDLYLWNQALWQPSVAAGLLSATDLAGWRNEQVFISQSRHVPPPNSAVRDLMPLYFELLEDEKEPTVKAVLGHFIFVYIHPYMDGNGRLARFILNMMLAEGGWPWTIIKSDDRTTYMNTLESASIYDDIRPFTKFINKQMSL